MSGKAVRETLGFLAATSYPSERQCSPWRSVQHVCYNRPIRYLHEVRSDKPSPVGPSSKKHAHQ